MGKVLKRILIISVSVVGAVIVAAGGYVGYVLLSYNRIGDIDLNVTGKGKEEALKIGQTYKSISYNIGFGAYAQDFTFFLDEGFDDAGNPTVGHGSKAKNKETVEFNISGAINTVKDYDPDFAFLQEVDTYSTRSYYMNQDLRFADTFHDYSHVFCDNFHTAFLPYPLYDMHGLVYSGMSTFSRYKMSEAKRKEYAVASSFSKYFDLDRCFDYAKVMVENGKSLYVVNSHMSAYDEGGEIRKKQVEQMNDFLQARKDAGDYVLIGGDWNHDLLINNPEFSYTMADKPFSERKKGPPWLSYFFDEETKKQPFLEGYRIVASDNGPTCRNNDIEWEPGKTFVCCVDGFIVSDNIQVVAYENLITKNGNKGYVGFAYSDHEPATMSFKLL